MWVYLSLILFLLQVDSRLPFNKELLLQPVEMDAYCTWWHTRVTWLNESHIWCTLYSSITSGSIAGCSSPHTRRKQSGIRSFDLNWLHLLLPKYTGNNVVFKSNIWNWDSIYLLVLTWKKKKNDCNWNPSIANEAPGTFQQLLILKDFYLSCQNYKCSFYWNESTSRMIKSL